MKKIITPRSFIDASFKYTVLTEEGETGTVSVAKQSKSVPSGAVTIPGSVKYGSVTYSVTSIGKGAFAGCSGLTSITIPRGVTSIGDGAFDGCSGLRNVVIGNGLTSIIERAFKSCRRLTSALIPPIRRDAIKITPLSEAYSLDFNPKLDQEIFPLTSKFYYIGGTYDQTSPPWRLYPWVPYP